MQCLQEFTAFHVYICNLFLSAVMENLDVGQHKMKDPTVDYFKSYCSYLYLTQQHSSRLL